MTKPAKAPAKPRKPRPKYEACPRCEASFPVGADGKIPVHRTWNIPTMTRVPCVEEPAS